MPRYVIGADVALELGLRATRPGKGAHLLAPTLIRSQMLSCLYRGVRAGRLTTQDAQACFDHVRSLRIRVLGDRVLLRAAWNVAERMSWEDTATAEYVALTQLQADAFVTLDEEVAREAARAVPVATLEQLLSS
ncbi:hypothetical protein AA0Y32_14575 [Georgenia phoenicis]|uniref:hypothetical protein n=1 Tax=unclassified Georgenia TaxID=2626815 RepID=UPI0039B0DC0B